MADALKIIFVGGMAAGSDAIKIAAATGAAGLDPQALPGSTVVGLV